MTTGIIFAQAYLRHEQSPTHPERSERLAYTIDQLTEEGIFDLSDIRLIEPRKATRSEVLLVHDEIYLKFLEEASITRGMIDYDTLIPRGLISDALLAAGGAVTAVNAVLNQEVRNAFVLSRPPGHHAGRSHGGGFCYLNNVAIAVRQCQRRGMRRVMILDWDAHHGNGTQDIFEDDPSVLFCSIHQFPFYPGSGQIDEIGTGEGTGYTVNMPVPGGSSDQVYHYLLREIIIPLAEEFQPDCIVISAGQDNHFTDPLTGLALTARGYATMMQEICILADSICMGRLVVILEGGYSVEGGLPYINLGIIAAMAGLDISHIREPDTFLGLLHRSVSDTALSHVMKTTDELRHILAPYWSCFR
ncbi:histone deacetylase family protein [Methanospirillum lacunae]|uniref:Histone deacetylase n=1 Tax=Methanospirillum lacunae TaxID=668570 RepID=A0A2V2N8K1_9EURY|nr:histone deacetylase [Methanospirillum lacunae]PWR74006.1 histone deacetylase [Methanospirillum lacunae]